MSLSAVYSAGGEVGPFYEEELALGDVDAERGACERVGRKNENACDNFDRFVL